MYLKIYPLLGKSSQSAIKRRLKYWGHKYYYNPRPALVSRLSKQLNMTESEILEQIKAEREYLIGNIRYFS